MTSRLIAAFIVLFAQQLHGRDYNIKHYSSAEGLPHAVVFRILEDSRGYLWLCTGTGVSRFDGRHFENYSAGQGLQSGDIFALAEDDRQQLWFASLDGSIDVLAPGDTTPHPWLPPATGGAPKGFIKLVHGEEGSWLLNKTGGLFFFRRDDPKKELQRIATGGRVHDLLYTHEKKLLLATDQGLLEAAGKIVRPYGFSFTGVLYSLAEDSRGQIWCGTEGRIVCARNDVPGNTVITGFAPPVMVMNIDRQDRLWFLVPEHGIFSAEDRQLIARPFGARVPGMLVNVITADAQGGVWLGTYGDGFYALRETGLTNFEDDVTRGSFITMLHSDTAGRVWAGTIDNGLVLIQNNTPASVSFNFRFFYESPRTLIPLDSSSYLLGTVGQLYHSRALLQQPRVVMDSGVIAAAFEHPRKVWLGCYLGLYLWEGSRVRQFAHPLLNRRRINAIRLRAPQELWLATDSGLIVMKNGLPRFFREGEAPPQGALNDLCFDARGRLWVAAENGLYCLENDRSRKFTVADGLRDLHCRSLACDVRGNVWIATVRGLACFDGRTFRHLDAEDGLPANEMTRLALDKKDRLWIGTVNGLASLDLSVFRFRNTPPRALLEQIRVNNRTYASAALTLTHRQNYLRIGFTAIDLSNSNSVVFSYRLNESAWTETSNGQADFPALPPGDYTFSVRARHKNSGWSEAAQFSFVITPPFWHAPWFLALSGALILLLAGVLVRWRIRRVRLAEREKLAQEKRLQWLRQQSLSNLLNPHFVFNSLNSVQHFINERDQHSANEYLARVAHLIRRTMNDGTHPLIPLSRELERLEDYLTIEKLRFGPKLSYIIRIDDDVDPEEILVPTMLVQPYVENAIWHGLMPQTGGGKVIVVISCPEPERVRITIEDNGAGYSPRTFTDASRPRGMEIAHERLELLGRALGRAFAVNIKAAPAGGTIVTIDLPLLTEPSLPE